MGAGQPARKLPRKLVESRNFPSSGGRSGRAPLWTARARPGKIKLADGDNDKVQEQRKQGGFASRSRVESSGDHHEIRERDNETSIAILATVEGSLPLRDWMAHRFTMTMNTKIMNGLKAWNQVTGISVLIRPGMSLRSVKSAPRGDRVALLFVYGPEERGRDAKQDQRDDGFPILGRELLLFFSDLDFKRAIRSGGRVRNVAR